MGAGDQGTSSEGVDILKNPTAEEPQAPAGTRKKGKEASAPEGGDLGLKLKEASTLGLGGTILKKRKEAMAALDIMLPTKPAARKAQPAGVEKKRKKVVRKKLPQDVIDSIVAKPCKIVYELSDEDLADKSQQFREAYRRAMLVHEKVRSYEQALMEQYRATGSVEDEIEVTDDEDEGTGENVTGDEETSANKVTGSVEDEIEVTDDEDERTGENVTGDEETSHISEQGHR